MKTLKLIAIGIILLVSNTSQAQLSVNLNIGTAPLWGPSVHTHTQYYYLPEIQAYYDIRASQFIYFGRGNWVRSRYLPAQYRNYDLYNGYKVVLNDYHGNRPYKYFKAHKSKYYVNYRGNSHRNNDYRYGNRNYDNHQHYNKKYYSNKYNKNSKKYRYADNHRYSNKHKKYESKGHGRH